MLFTEDGGWPIFVQVTQRQPLLSPEQLSLLRPSGQHTHNSTLIIDFLKYVLTRERTLRPSLVKVMTLFETLCMNLSLPYVPVSLTTPSISKHITAAFTSSATSARRYSISNSKNKIPIPHSNGSVSQASQIPIPHPREVNHHNHVLNVNNSNLGTGRMTGKKGGKKYSGNNNIDNHLLNEKLIRERCGIGDRSGDRDKTGRDLILRFPEIFHLDSLTRITRSVFLGTLPIGVSPPAFNLTGGIGDHNWLNPLLFSSLGITHIIDCRFPFKDKNHNSYNNNINSPIPLISSSSSGSEMRDRRDSPIPLCSACSLSQAQPPPVGVTHSDPSLGRESPIPQSLGCPGCSCALLPSSRHFSFFKPSPIPPTQQSRSSYLLRSRSRSTQGTPSRNSLFSGQPSGPGVGEHVLGGGGVGGVGGADRSSLTSTRASTPHMYSRAGLYEPTRPNTSASGSRPHSRLSGVSGIGNNTNPLALSVGFGAGLGEDSMLQFGGNQNNFNGKNNNFDNDDENEIKIKSSDWDFFPPNLNNNENINNGGGIGIQIGIGGLSYDEEAEQDFAQTSKNIFPEGQDHGSRERERERGETKSVGSGSSRGNTLNNTLRSELLGLSRPDTGFT